MLSSIPFPQNREEMLYINIYTQNVKIVLHQNTNNGNTHTQNLQTNQVNIYNNQLNLLINSGPSK
jgi:hypothetical protein